MKNKKGISLVVLTVTIAIMLILVSTVFINVNNSVHKANLSSFYSELSEIEEQIRTYYAVNEKFPVINGTTKLSLQEVYNLSNLSEDYKNLLNKEIISNGDNESNLNEGEFYQIDLTKLDLENISNGRKQNGDNDVFLVSAYTLNVYYLKGRKIGDEVYFSLSFNLINATNVNNKRDISTTTVQKIKGIVAKNNVKNWNNKMGINIQTTLEKDEKVYLKISGINEQKELISTEGIHQINFDNLEESKKYISLTDVEISSFNNFTESKYIDVIRKKGDVTIGSIKLDLSKYDNIAPILSQTLWIEAREEENIAYFSVNDENRSGIKEIRYEYLTVMNKNGQIVPYYDNTTELDASYLMSNGKRANASNTGEVQLRLPKEIMSIQILVTDDAGNQSNFTQITKPDIYVGYNAKIVDYNKITFDLVINSVNGISLANTYISNDGIDYTNMADYTQSDFTNNEIINVAYRNISNPNEKLYVKAVVTDKNPNVNERKTEIRVFQFDTNDRYVKNGLIVWLDAQENIQTGHGANTLIWDDLSLNGNNAMLFNFNNTTIWNDKYLTFDGVNNFATINNVITNLDNFTIQIVYTPREHNRVQYFFGIKYMSFGLHQDTNLNRSFYYNDSKKEYADSSGFKIQNDKIAYVTYVFNDKNEILEFINDEQIHKFENAEKEIIDSIFTIGASDYHGDYTSKMDLYTFRIYNRALNGDEVKRNYNIDKRRFE